MFILLFVECEEGWVLFGDNCYLHQTIQPYINWIDAEQACRYMGAHLTSILSETEMIFLHSYILKQVANSTFVSDFVSFIGM